MEGQANFIFWLCLGLFVIASALVLIWFFNREPEDKTTISSPYDGSPDATAKSDMREYTVKYKDSKEEIKKVKTRAANRFDAKFRAFAEHKIPLDSILSVI